MGHMFFIRKRHSVFWVFSASVNHGRCGFAEKGGMIQLDYSYHEILWQNFEIQNFQLLQLWAIFVLQC